MKHKSKFLVLTVAALLFSMSALVLSCKKDSDPISADIKASVSNEATMEAQQDEVDDIASAQMNSSSPSGKSQTGSPPDARTVCAYITAEVADKTGTITIDFNKNSTGGANEAGCTDAKGNVRKGKIIISWAGGKWYQAGAAITISLDNYSINGVVITGQRILTNITEPNHPLIIVWTVVASHTATWPDGTSATREVHKTRAWDILQGTVTVSQTSGDINAANGTTRNSKVYSVQITDPLVYSVDCIATNSVYFPIRGVKIFTIETNEISFDFGTGSCDKTFTISFNGRTDTITATN